MAPFGDGFGRALLALQCERICCGAKCPISRPRSSAVIPMCTVSNGSVSADHHVEVLCLAHVRPNAGWLQVAATAHRFDAAGERTIGIAKQDVLGRRNDRLETAAAETIERQCWRAGMPH